MEMLIKIYKSEGGKDVVSARELYEFLKVKRDFSNWCKQMFDYGFEQGKDFTPILAESTGGRPSSNYAITLDTAKEISMIQRSEKGKIARQYFIACEKRLREVANQPKELSRKDLAMLVIQAEEEKEKVTLQLNEAQKQIEENKPKVAFADAVSDSETDILMRDLAKLIAQNGFVIGEHRLYDWMVVGGYLEARKRWSAKRSKYETQYWPTQRAIALKVFRVKETVIHEGSKSAFLKPTVKVNGKGQQYFINKFLSAT